MKPVSQRPRALNSARPTITSSLKSVPGHCEHCRRPLGTFASGHSRVGNKQLCRPNVDTRPNCYKLVTVHGHEMPCQDPDCYEKNEENEKDKKVTKK